MVKYLIWNVQWGCRGLPCFLHKHRRKDNWKRRQILVSDCQDFQPFLEKQRLSHQANAKTDFFSCIKVGINVLCREQNRMRERRGRGRRRKETKRRKRR